ncbi:MAG: class I SAM-dependent methyltransferase [Bacteriovoracaceae bacterium]|nr:class I SAM-dependent methyltransferase [Bacteriovoracaceae bacterium]
MNSFFYRNLTDSQGSLGFIDGISSSYDEFLDKISFEKNTNVIVEIGAFNGGGTEVLINTFKGAKVYTFELKNPHDEEYVCLNTLAENLSGRAELIIEKSPPSTFTENVDLCVFDIGSEYDNIMNNFNFWYKHLSFSGVLVMLVPWGNSKKRETREIILRELRERSIPYQEIVNWVIVRRSLK